MSYRLRIAVAGLTVATIMALASGPSVATFSGKDGRISYATYAGGDLEIHSANPDGSDVKRLTKTPGPRGAVISDWSPDGERIAFDGNAIDINGLKDVMQIYTMDADGTNVVQLTRGPGFHGFPGWSPDGVSIAIDADWGKGRKQQGIWIVPATDPDGVTVEEARRLTTLPDGFDFDSEPQYSPDGDSIVFTRFKSAEKSAIHRVNVDGSGLNRLTSYGLNASDPDWSPAGSEIVFDSADGSRIGSRADIYVMRANGSREKRLTHSPPLIDDFESPFDLANNPVWSPSGKQIMYTRFTPASTRLVVMNANGTNRRTVISRRKLVNKVDWGTHP